MMTTALCFGENGGHDDQNDAAGHGAVCGNGMWRSAKHPSRHEYSTNIDSVEQPKYGKHAALTKCYRRGAIGGSK